MKRLSLIFFILLFKNSYSQETITYLNDHGESVKEKKASFLLQQLKVNDSLWEFNFYELYGPIIKTIQTKDEKGTVKNGIYKNFQNGIVDTIGYYANGLPDKKWKIYTDRGRIIKELKYENGNFVSEKDSAQINTELKKEIDSLKLSTQTFSKVEIESEFAGGLPAWQRYLIKNLRYPDRAVSNYVQGNVIIQFIVNKDGKIENSEVIKSVEYSLDKEALRMIKNSPDWIPAVQNGRKVKSYKKQPINFRLQKG
jgi:periplasmic protein TonB